MALLLLLTFSLHVLTQDSPQQTPDSLSLRLPRQLDFTLTRRDENTAGNTTKYPDLSNNNTAVAYYKKYCNESSPYITSPECWASYYEIFCDEKNVTNETNCITAYYVTYCKSTSPYFNITYCVSDNTNSHGGSDFWYKTLMRDAKTNTTSAVKLSIAADYNITVQQGDSTVSAPIIIDPTGIVALPPDDYQEPQNMTDVSGNFTNTTDTKAKRDLMARSSSSSDTVPPSPQDHDSAKPANDAKSEKKSSGSKESGWNKFLDWFLGRSRHMRRDIDPLTSILPTLPTISQSSSMDADPMPTKRSLSRHRFGKPSAQHVGRSSDATDDVDDVSVEDVDLTKTQRPNDEKANALKAVHNATATGFGKTPGRYNTIGNLKQKIKEYQEQHNITHDNLNEKRELTYDNWLKMLMRDMADFDAADPEEKKEKLSMSPDMQKWLDERNSPHPDFHSFYDDVRRKDDETRRNPPKQPWQTQHKLNVTEWTQMMLADMKQLDADPASKKEFLAISPIFEKYYEERDKPHPDWQKWYDQAPGADGKTKRSEVSDDPAYGTGHERGESEAEAARINLDFQKMWAAHPELVAKIHADLKQVEKDHPLSGTPGNGSAHHALSKRRGILLGGGHKPSAAEEKEITEGMDKQFQEFEQAHPEVKTELEKEAKTPNRTYPHTLPAFPTYTINVHEKRQAEINHTHAALMEDMKAAMQGFSNDTAIQRETRFGKYMAKLRAKLGHHSNQTNSHTS